MRAILGILAILSIPLILMNLLGGIVSGIWLVVLGEWRAIGLGILSLFCSTMLIGFALLPSFLFALPAAKFIEHGKYGFGIIIGMPAALYTVGVMIAWCLLVLVVFEGMADEASRIPMLIWSYGVATGPWSYMASKEHEADDDFNPSTLHTFFVSIGYLLMIAMILVFKTGMEMALLGLCIVMACSFVFQLATIPAAISRQRALDSLDEYIQN